MSKEDQEWRSLFNVAHIWGIPVVGLAYVAQWGFPTWDIHGESYLHLYVCIVIFRVLFEITTSSYNQGYQDATDKTKRFM